MAPSTGAACHGSTAAASLPRCSTPNGAGPGRSGRKAEWTSTQRYLPRTNILETTFRTADDGIVSVTDFMPVAEDGRPSGPHPEIHRRLRCTRGRVPMNIIFMPRFEYGARTTRLELLRAGLFATDRTDQVLTLSSAKPFEWVIEQSTATARFEMEKGEERWLVLRYDDDDIHPVGSLRERPEAGQHRGILAAVVVQGALPGALTAGMVKRSALALKLLTHAETGAMIAAPTTSLPETIGGMRNWDYRFVWLRDAAFTLAALDAVGHHAEADSSCASSRRSAATRAAATSRSCTVSTAAAT